MKEVHSLRNMTIAGFYFHHLQMILPMAEAALEIFRSFEFRVAFHPHGTECSILVCRESRPADRLDPRWCNLTDNPSIVASIPPWWSRSFDGPATESSMSPFVSRVISTNSWCKRELFHFHKPRN